MQKCIYAGTVTRNAELITIGGNNYAKFSLAVYDGKDKEGNSKTLWLDVLKFDKDGNYTPYIIKGLVISVEGKITASGYSKDGVIKTSLTLWCDNIFRLHTPKTETETPYVAPPQNVSDSSVPTPAKFPQRPKPSTPPPVQQINSNDDFSTDDDLPF